MISLLTAMIFAGFAALGVSDSLLGSAWPSMYEQFRVPLSASGAVFMMISIGQVTASLLHAKIARRLNTGQITVCSFALMAGALFGFSASTSVSMLCVFAVPYGFGVGNLDVGFNNFMALHCSSRLMNWFHCMWGIGSAAGPVLMGRAVSSFLGWRGGYRIVAGMQTAVVLAFLLSLPLWKKLSVSEAVQEAGLSPENISKKEKETDTTESSWSLKENIRFSGVPLALLCFFCYYAIEQSTSLWAGSYFLREHGFTADRAAGVSGIFFIGVTAGRVLSGMLSSRFTDTRMVRIGQCTTGIGILLVLLPLSQNFAMGGLILIGLGCAPVIPGMIHATPAWFGRERSRVIIGIENAAGFMGSTFMAPLCGWLCGKAGFALYPFFIMIFLVLMMFAHRKLTSGKRKNGAGKRYPVAPEKPADPFQAVYTGKRRNTEGDTPVAVLKERMKFSSLR